MPLIKDGGWNYEIFVPKDFSGDLQSEINNGKLPRADFTSTKEPLNFLKIVLNYQMTRDMYSNLGTIDSMTGLFAEMATNLDPQIIDIITSKYMDLIKEGLYEDNRFDIYDDKTKTNSTWVEFFDELMLANAKDMFRSSNPAANHMATQYFSSEIIHDLINSDDNGQSIELDILHAKSLMDSEIAPILFNTDLGINPNYNDFYIDIEDGGATLSSNYFLGDFINPFGSGIINRMAKTSGISPFDPNGASNQFLHNVVGSYQVDFVYPQLAHENAARFETIFRARYDQLGLISPNRGGLDAILASFDLSFSLDFFRFGVRNDYGTMPIITRMYFQIFTNQQYYYTESGAKLLAYTHSVFLP